MPSSDLIWIMCAVVFILFNLSALTLSSSRVAWRGAFQAELCVELARGAKGGMGTAVPGRGLCTFLDSPVILGPSLAAQLLVLGSPPLEFPFLLGLKAALGSWLILGTPANLIKWIYCKCSRLLMEHPVSLPHLCIFINCRLFSCVALCLWSKAGGRHLW